MSPVEMNPDFGSVADTAAAGWSAGRFELRWGSVLYPRHSLNILSQLRTLFQRMMGRVVSQSQVLVMVHGRVEEIAAATENLVELVGLEPTASSLRTTRSPN